MSYGGKKKSNIIKVDNEKIREGFNRSTEAITDKDQQLEENVLAAQNSYEQAKEQADITFENAQTANVISGEVQRIATEANELSTMAKEIAEQSIASSQSALEVSQKSDTTPLEAKKDTQTALQQSNEAKGGANRTVTDSGEALTKSSQALTKSEDSLLQLQNTQAQVNSLVIQAGNFSAQVLQALTNASGETFNTLKGVLDDKGNKIDVLSKVTVTIDSFPIQPLETDDTARINRAINYIDSLGGGELILTSGLYNVSTPTIDKQNAVVLKSNISIRGTGEVILKLAPNNLTNYAIIHIQNCNNVSVKNIKVIGESDEHLGTSGRWGMGFNIKESTNIILDNVEAENCWGDGLYLGTITFKPVINNQNIIIKNSRFKGRRNATSFISLINGLIDNCTFSDASGTFPMAGMDIEPNDEAQIVEYVTIRNCEFRNNKSVGFTTARVRNNVRNIKIIDTKFIDNAGFSFSGEKSNVKNLELRGCTFINSILSRGNKNDGSPASTIKGAENVTIEGNTFINSGKITIQKNPVTGEISKNIIVSKNKFIDSVGLEIRSGKNIKVASNIIEDFTNFGIFVNKIDAIDTKEIMIHNNQIYGSKGGSAIACGIRLDAGDELIVKDNICRKDDANLMIRGIAVESATGQVTLAGNDCKDGGASFGIKNNGTLVHLYQNRMKDGTWSNTAN
ncbi:right-handed parallel beta-helix repeat-containing protein [Priestia filamentosa]|uniref:right-handed parallel beta-helix repeat-containing protein n=1 Tax=Priestia filamentosa TaxID=1402861 RepID=UPI00234A38DE|nr:right-handed parallel beta-helix repeat-containing protein [Priestia filamentosa]WCM14556.1 right-handed parallel beta-helix repeat-containing protein [Priestia filamentosa]